MAVVTTKSGPITNRDASPQVKNNSLAENGMIRESVGFVAAVSGDSIGSVYLMCAVPSGARVSAVTLFNDAITTCAGSVGLYQSTDIGGAAVSAGLFAVGASLATASVPGTDVTHATTGTFLNTKAEQPLWQVLGLTKDPSLTYYVAITLTAAAGSAGNIAMKVRYAI